jgi:hypothetical protein
MLIVLSLLRSKFDRLICVAMEGDAMFGLLLSLLLLWAQEGRRVINGVTHSGSKLPIYSLTTLVCIEFLSSGENFNLKLRKGSHIQNHYEIDCFWLFAPGLHAMMMMM